ncbi:MAG: restriction endonuclease [Bradymonadia bacterium]
MAIPTYDEMIYPLLQILAATTDGARSRDVYVAVAEHFQLTDDDRRQMLPSGKQHVYKNRVGWAQDRLKRSGFSESAKRGFWRITPLGVKALTDNPDGFDADTLQSLCKINKQDSKAAVHAEALIPPVMESKSPLERLHEAMKEMRESLRVELLELVKSTSPDFFETLVLDVLHAMGYGATSDDLVRTQSSADEGIDGVITLDRLGLEKVYIQAKRWTKGTVGRPEIQKFFGALAGQTATRGVFITTSTFSKGAYSYARQVPGSIVLVDGSQLADLMIEYEVGVSAQEVFRVVRVDLDYFEEG